MTTFYRTENREAADIVLSYIQMLTPDWLYCLDGLDKPLLGEWSNCREQGYILSFKEWNIAFFEHRNSDNVCAIKWRQTCHPNQPTITTADFKSSNVYKNKYDISYKVNTGDEYQMAEWIINEFHTIFLIGNEDLT